MPTCQMIHKAGKLSFLLVCLFLCNACGSSKEAVFVSGTEGQGEITEEMTDMGAKGEEILISETEEENLANRLVNINTAEIEELMTLPGIGEVRATAIIDHRRQEGDFEKIEDIMNVKGIKTGIFSKISSLICVK